MLSHLLTKFAKLAHKVCEPCLWRKLIHFFRVSFNAHSLVWYSSTLRVCIRYVLLKWNWGRNKFLPILDCTKYTRLLFIGVFLHDPGEFYLQNLVPVNVLKGKLPEVTEKQLC